MKWKGRRQSINVTRTTNNTGKGPRKIPPSVIPNPPKTKMGEKVGLKAIRSTIDKTAEGLRKARSIKK